jgi:ADP-ribose pyrophosphatase YjhB (NUDIX family)
VGAVGAVVVDRDARVLLIRRGRPPSAGTWTLPGGRLEPGESLQDAVRREVLEETGVAVEVVCELCCVTIRREGYVFLVHEFLALPALPDAAPPRAGDDADDVRWTLPDEWPGMGVLEDAAAVLLQGLAEAGRRRLLRNFYGPHC